jgi:superoxide dismutase
MPVCFISGLEAGFYWRLQNQSVINNLNTTLDRLEEKSRVLQHSEIIEQSLELMIAKVESSIGNDSFFCTAFRIFNDTKVHTIFLHVELF